MHTLEDVKSADFQIAFEGRSISLEELFPDFDHEDRIESRCPHETFHRCQCRWSRYICKVMFESKWMNEPGKEESV